MEQLKKVMTVNLLWKPHITAIEMALFALSSYDLWLVMREARLRKSLKVLRFFTQANTLAAIFVGLLLRTMVMCEERDAGWIWRVFTTHHCLFLLVFYLPTAFSTAQYGLLEHDASDGLMLSLAFIGGVFATGVAITASGECLHDEMKELAPNFCFFPEESSYKVCNIVALSAMLAFLLIGGATNAINAKTMRTRSDKLLAEAKTAVLRRKCRKTVKAERRFIIYSTTSHITQIICFLYELAQALKWRPPSWILVETDAFNSAEIRRTKSNTKKHLDCSYQ